MTEHVATVEATLGDDGVWLAEVYCGEDVVSGWGATRAEALSAALTDWLATISEPEDATDERTP